MNNVAETSGGMEHPWFLGCSIVYEDVIALCVNCCLRGGEGKRHEGKQTSRGVLCLCYPHWLSGGAKCGLVNMVMGGYGVSC